MNKKELFRLFVSMVGILAFSNNNRAYADPVSAVSPPQWAMNGDLGMIKSNKIESAISSSGYQFINVGGTSSFVLNEGNYIKQISFVRDEGMIFLINEAVPRGANYCNLIYIKCQNNGADAIVEFRQAMQRGSIGYSDPVFEYYILKLGNVRDYPRILLLMGKREKNGGTSKAIYEWQMWDFIKQKIIKKFDNIDKGPFVLEPKEEVNGTSQQMR